MSQAGNQGIEHTQWLDVKLAQTARADRSAKGYYLAVLGGLICMAGSPSRL